MKKQAKNFRLLLMCCATVALFLGLSTSNVLAQDPPNTAFQGELPIPGTSKTIETLFLKDHGTILENNGSKLVWEEDGNLQLYFYSIPLWDSKTGGTGNQLTFQKSNGKLFIRNTDGDIIWHQNNGNKLWLLNNKNLILKNSDNQTIWSTGTTMPNLKEDLQLLGPIPGVKFAEGYWVDYTINRYDNLETYDWDYGQDYKVPNTTYKYFYLEAEGGDGGNRKVLEAWGTTRFNVKGGSGATIKAIFEIGTGDRQIPPGSIIRFIVGTKAETRTGQTTAGSGGGGGTAIFVKRPDSKVWQLLMVAGGGGGAYSDCCAVKREGRSAETYDDGRGGDGGKVNSLGHGKAGSNGYNGHTGGAGDGEPGGSAFGYDFEAFDSPYCGWVQGDKNAENLPTGGFSKDTYDGNEKPGGGFGSGGDGGTGGGGGGGYSGGGLGKAYYPGGGGGSYLTDEFAIRESLKLKNSSTSSPQDGFVRYKLMSDELIFDLINRSIQFATNTNKCLNNAGGSTANSTNIQTNNCDGDEKKKWMFDSNSQGLRLENVQNKCINLPGASTSNGNNIELKDCNNTWGQRWYYNAVYKSLHSGADLDKCMLVNNGFTSPGANNNIKIYDCQYGNIPQQWEITQATSVDDPTAKLGFVPKSKTTLAIHSRTDTEVGSNIQLWTYSTTNTAMKWQFDGLKLRLNNRSDRCIDLQNGSTSNGTNVHLWECKDKNTQEWLFDGFTNTIRSGANPQKCLQVNGSYEKRANIELWDCNGSERQEFLIK